MKPNTETCKNKCCHFKGLKCMIARAQILHEYLHGTRKVYGQGELLFDDDFQVPEACPYQLEFLYENELALEKGIEYNTDPELDVKQEVE